MHRLTCPPPLPGPAQTLYSVKAEILPPAGAQHCRTGSLCPLEVTITRLPGLLEGDRDDALTEVDERFCTKLLCEGGSRAAGSLPCHRGRLRPWENTPDVYMTIHDSSNVAVRKQQRQ